MMSPVIGETALSGFPTYAVPPAGCYTATLNGSLAAVSRAALSIGVAAAASRAAPGVDSTVCGYPLQSTLQTGATVSRAAPGVDSTVCGYPVQSTLQTGATLGKALASVRFTDRSLDTCSDE